jgi:HD-GYP domain-containing protein (c-di-GMP phosphodiesterase class II)
MHTAESVSNQYYEKILCNDLRIGMYVQELDRPWLETPFMFQGFCIRHEDEIETLRKYCEYVLVNSSENDIDVAITHTKVESAQPARSRIKEIASKTTSSGRYSDSVIVEKELNTARKIYAESSDAIANIFERAHSDGTVNLNDTRQFTTSIVDSVMRNPDAFMLLQRLKGRGPYRYTHAVNCCALAASFCRHLGFSKTEIQDISMGALLLDIGITKLPDAMLETPGTLNPLSMKLVRNHVSFGLKVLDNTPELPPIIRQMVLTHHERVNGKGYPNALKGEQIPVCGSVAAIIDCYDAMVCSRPYKESISPTDAACTMYNWRNADFNEDLIEQFIQCIGAYPTGSLVELNSGQVGIVISQNRVRRLYPRILLIMNADKVNYENPKTIDLLEYAQKTKGTKLEIKKTVDADELGIEPADYYL